MDPIGITASIITLIEASVATVRIIDSLIQSYRNAPAELVRLKHELDGLNSQLFLLRHIQDSLSQDALCFIGEEVAHLNQFLSSVVELYIQIRDGLLHETLESGSSGRLKWAMTTSRRVTKWKREIQHHSSDLGHVMILLNVLVLPYLRELETDGGADL
jgi:hypothetical protein